MPLSIQETARVKELRGQKYTDKEIAGILKKERAAAAKAAQPSFGKKALEFGKGVVKSAGETIVGASNLGERALNSVLDTIGLESGMSDAGTLFSPNIGQDAASQLGIGLDKMKAANEYQSAGKLAGDVVQFLAPSSAALKLETKASVGLAKYLSRSPKVAKALGAATTLGIEGNIAGGIQMVKAGKPDESVVEAAVYGVVGAGVANTIGASVKAIRDFGTSGIGKRALGQLKRVLPAVPVHKVKALLGAAQDFLDNGGVNRPTDIVGKAFYTGVEKVRAFRDQIGERIGGAVDRLKKNAFISLHNAADELAGPLMGKHVKIDQMKNIGALDFSESELRNLADEGVIREFWDEFFKPSIRSTTGVDGLANQSIVYPSASPRALLAGIRRISNEIYSETVKKSGFGAGKGILEQMRQIMKSRLDDYIMRSGDKELIELNKVYSDIYDALPEVEKLIGEGGQTAAQVLRRIESNAGGKVRYAVEKLQEVAAKNGIDDFRSVLDEITLANVIENAYGVVEQNSLAGQVGLGISTARNATEAAAGHTGGLFAWIGSLALAGADAVRGSTREQLVNFIVRFYQKQGEEITRARASGMIGAMGGKDRIVDVVAGIAKKARRDAVRRFSPVEIPQKDVLESAFKGL